MTSPHRQSVRLPDYDYSQPGAYFITVVTHGRRCLFGEVLEGEVRLSAVGELAAECWRDIPVHFPRVELGTYVIMPNHIHGILILGDRQVSDSPRRGTIYRAPTQERFQKPVTGSVPTIVRTYKAAVTRLVGSKIGRSSLWHRNYYEHVIRDDDEHQLIHEYIETNPLTWSSDQENPLLIKESP